MKLLITGSRYWRDRQTIWDVLTRFPAGPTTVLVHGDCRGADKIAGEIGKHLGFDVRPYPAKWHLYRDAAGPIRNQEMINKEHLIGDEIDICIAFHDDLQKSKGTKDMLERAGKAGINTRIFCATHCKLVAARDAATGRR